MFKFIQKLLNLIVPNNTESLTNENENYEFSKQIILKELAKKEIEISPFIKKDKESAFIEFICGNIEIGKNNTLLSLDDKKRLNINTRYKVDNSIIDIFNLDKLEKDFFQTTHPKEFLHTFYYKINFKASRIIDIKRMKKTNIKEVVYKTSGGFGTCDWCVDNEEKIFDIEQILTLIDKNCTCDCNSSFFEPIIKFE